MEQQIAKPKVPKKLTVANCDAIPIIIAGINRIGCLVKKNILAGYSPILFGVMIDTAMPTKMLLSVFENANPIDFCCMSKRHLVCSKNKFSGNSKLATIK